VCALLCALLRGGTGRKREANTENVDEITLLMKDVYVFLYTRITCFSEELKLETETEEVARLEDIKQEIITVKKYLYADPRDMGPAFELIQSKILLLLEEAKSAHTYSNPAVQDHLNQTSDVLLGCICLILSTDEDQGLSDPEEDCGENTADADIYLLIAMYSDNQKGGDVDQEEAEDLFLSLQQSKTCNFISSGNRQQIDDMLNM